MSDNHEISDNCESDTEDEIGASLASGINAGRYEDPFKSPRYVTNVVAKEYCKTWQSKHAFREYYQNWDDAIRERLENEFREQGSIKQPHHTKRTLCFRAVHPNTSVELGFIRLHKKRGILELTNYDSRLPARSLGIGGSTKQNQQYLAGSYGEGYKVAAAVLTQKNYATKITASGCDLYSHVPDEGEKDQGLLCFINVKRPAARLQKAIEKHANLGVERKQISLRQSATDDVTFSIGPVKKKGICRGNHVTQDDFLQWSEVALDLDPPTRLIDTEYGRILLDQRFEGKVFLKGLLVDKGLEIGRVQFGYNFRIGKVDRDRQSLREESVSADILASMWEVAIKNDPTIAVEYLQMLLLHTRPADVMEAEEYLRKGTLEILWQQLLRKDEGRENFYFDKENHSDAEIIIHTLKKMPVPLPQLLWKKFRSLRLVQSPQERLERKLYSAPDSTKKSTAYSDGVKRAFNGVLRLDAATKNLKVVFKQGTQSQLDLFLRGKSVIINDKWLDFQSSHTSSECDLFLEASQQHVNIDTFSCGHIITDLYDLLLAELCRSPRRSRKVSPIASTLLRRRAGEKIKQIPSRLCLKPGVEASIITVSWTEFESERVWKNYGVVRYGRVTLHRESTCSKLKNEILSSDTPAAGNFQESIGTTTNAPCGCPEQIVLLKDSSASFENLIHDEEYFPMISGTAPQSFFGIPPSPLRHTTVGQKCPVPSAHIPNAGNTKNKETAQITAPGRVYGRIAPGNNSTRSNTIQPANSCNNMKEPHRPPFTVKLVNSNGDQKKQLEAAEVNLRRLERELEIARAEAISLKSKIAELKTARDSDNNELDKLRRGLEYTTEVMNKLETDKKDIQEQLTNETKAMEGLLLKVQEHEKEQSRNNLQLKDTKTQLSTLQSEIEPLRRKEENSRAEIESLKRNIQQLQNQNERLSGYLGGAEKDIEDVYHNLQGRKRAREAEQVQSAAEKRTKNS